MNATRDLDEVVEALAVARVAEIEREREERRRAEAREDARLVEAAWECLGDGPLPTASERRSEPAARTPEWAETIGLSEDEAREVAAAPVKWYSDPIKVAR